MKIAFIATHDGYNLAIANLIKALLERNHDVHIFAHLYTEHHLKIFKDYNIPLHDLKQITSSVLEGYDTIFAQNEFLRNFNLFNINKYVYTINDNVFHEARSAADFIFSNGEKWKEDVSYPFEKDCVIMETGCLKINESIQSECYDDHTILFIDSGHMPYSAKGKKELAKLLLSICERFKDYCLIIKPRILPGSKHATHRNDNHLYDNIIELCNGKIPANMTMLMEHLQLGKLIQQSKVVLCLYTTAYLEAVLYNKNIIIIDELPNEDSIGARIHTFFNPTKDILRSTGCLVPYTEVLNYLPNGIKCSEFHINEQVYYQGYVAEIMADIMEYIYIEFLSKGFFPRISTYQCLQYKEIMQVDQAIDFNKIIQNRIANCLRYDVGIIKKNLNCLDTCFDDKINRLINDALQDTSLTKTINYNKKMNEIIALFLYHQKELSSDAITQTYLLYCRIMLNQIKEVAEMQVPIGCLSISLYAKGLLCFQNKQTNDAIKYFEQYLDLVEKNSYDTTVADTLRDRVYSALVISYMFNGIRRKDLYKKISSNFLQGISFSVMSGNMSPENAIRVFCRSNKHYII